MLVSPHIQRGRTYGIPHIWTPDDEFGIPGDIEVLPSSGNYSLFPAIDAAHDHGKTNRRWRRGRYSELIECPQFESLAGIQFIPLTGSYVATQSKTASTRPRIGGLIHRQISTIGNVGFGEDNLLSYAMPADTLGYDGEQVDIVSWGDHAGNANTKTVKQWFGATAIETTANPTNGGAWVAKSSVIRVSNTAQTAFGTMLSTYVVTGDAEVSTPAETLSGAVTIKCTGQSAIGTDNDVRQFGMMVYWWPAI
jgi:hypothetical protein